jgi:hypothetical protein
MRAAYTRCALRTAGPAAWSARAALCRSAAWYSVSGAVRRTEWPWPRADGLAGVDGLAGGYATDEVALAPEPFDARHHWSGSSRSIWSKSLFGLGALEVVERGRRETVVLSDR